MKLEDPISGCIGAGGMRMEWGRGDTDGPAPGRCDRVWRYRMVRLSLKVERTEVVRRALRFVARRHRWWTGADRRRIESGRFPAWCKQRNAKQQRLGGRVLRVLLPVLVEGGSR